MTIEKYSLLKIPANKPVRMKTLEYHYFTCPSEITDEGNDPPLLSSYIKSSREKSMRNFRMYESGPKPQTQ
jgi:hypothetical protein